MITTATASVPAYATFSAANATNGGRAASSTSSSTSGTQRTGNSASTQGELSAEEVRAIETLKAADREVRAHEAAHIALGGALVTSGASYTFERGPDGKSYAIAGEVSIDTSKAQSAEETLSKAAHIRATALAPAKPSAQDRRVAATADQMAAQASLAISAQQRELLSGPTAAAFQSAAYGQLAMPTSGNVINTYA